MSQGTPRPRWVLTLYVNGASPRSAEAIEVIRQICDEDLADRADLRIVNAADDPAQVARDHILALPTLVKHAPAPSRHLVGNLADMHRVRLGLDLAPAPTSAATSDAERP